MLHYFIPEVASPAGHLTDTSTADTRLLEIFAHRSVPYYRRVLDHVSRSARTPLTFNWAAALIGAPWAAARGLWTFFWTTVLIDLAVVALLGFGLWADLGKDDRLRADMLAARAQDKVIEAMAARGSNDPSASAIEQSAASLSQAAEMARNDAERALGSASKYAILGVLLAVISMLGRGWLANICLERRFQAWRRDRDLPHGMSLRRAIAAAAIQLSLVFLIIDCLTLSDPPSYFTRFPADRVVRQHMALRLEEAFHWLTYHAEFIFDPIKLAITRMQTMLEAILVGTPWPIVMTVILAAAWGFAGARVAIFTAAVLIYLGILDYWELSMTTVALLGTAAFLAITIGLPLGILCGKRPRVYVALRPILDFMQTMPSFVYLIPVIALFGTGKAPAIIATLMYGVPPTVRLTALGIQGVPNAVREAAVAFGATPLYVLTRVEIPLAMPSIMAGVNQTILISLAMVVVASLIGAKGLGEEVLEALQYAAVGDGLLAGFAILFCAMVIDRIVQGKRKPMNLG